jgi:hypothetical protein
VPLFRAHNASVARVTERQLNRAATMVADLVGDVLVGRDGVRGACCSRAAGG